MISMRSRSGSSTCCASQNTPPNSGVYTLRPSIITSSLLFVMAENPRVAIAQLPPLKRATLTLSASRSASASVSTP